MSLYFEQLYILNYFLKKVIIYNKDKAFERKPNLNLNDHLIFHGGVEVNY